MHQNEILVVSGSDVFKADNVVAAQLVKDQGVVTSVEIRKRSRQDHEVVFLQHSGASKTLQLDWVGGLANVLFGADADFYNQVLEPRQSPRPGLSIEEVVAAFLEVVRSRQTLARDFDCRRFASCIVAKIAIGDIASLDFM
jgi:hypothetical protein